MTKIPFYGLEIVQQSRKGMYGDSKKNVREKGHIGIDTETYKGKVKIIADSFRRCEEIESAIQLLQFLNYKKYRGNFCWFWNIQYDFDSIVKWFPRDNIREMYFTGETTYEGYHIHYLQGKYFELHQHKNPTRFYDMYNFLNTSLEYAAKTYLGIDEGKINNIDGNSLNTDLGYWDKNYENIVKYCIHDAKLTGRLAVKFWDIVNKTLKMNPRKPFSKGAYSQEYFLSKCFVPRVHDIPTEVLNYAYQSYYGGRFELLQRGYFPQIYIYDLKSAYPSIIAQLPDYRRGLWHKHNIGDVFNSDYLHGFYYCDVKATNDAISPFMQKRHDVNCYCNGAFTVYLTAYEIDYINRRFPGSEINIIDGYFWEPNGPVHHPFKKEVEKLFTWKEIEKDEHVRYVVKTFLNALAGKFNQCIGGKTGKLFNPLYASECSAWTRIKLLDAARLAGFNNVIGFSTDAIHCTRKFIPDKTREDSLGDFVEDFKGEGVYILSDIYTVWNDDKIKNKFRGKQLILEEIEGARKTKSIKTILEELGDQATKYIYRCNRPIHLGEAITHTKHAGIDSINIFHEDERSLDINGDLKRVWEKRFVSAAEALETHHVSEPLVLGV